MSRVMIDVTHAGLPTALSSIKALLINDVVALYDTGSPNIAATPADIALIPSRLKIIFIDQGFTGSPNAKATVRDCENGAWDVVRAIHQTPWNAPRPTLYLGFPDTVQEAFNAGWRGDVWLVIPSEFPPPFPPPVPKGINVVAVQWSFTPEFDSSVIFDPTWPEGNVSIPVSVANVQMQHEWRWCSKCQGIFYGPNESKSVCPAGGTHIQIGSGDYMMIDLTETTGLRSKRTRIQTIAFNSTV